MKHLLTALVLATLTACGGGGSSTPEAAQPAAPACVTVSPVRIQIFGDSTNVGYVMNTGTIARPSPAEMLQTAMDARFGPGAVVVELRAVSGTDTAQLLAGTDGLNLPWPQSVRAHIVLINHAINDHYHGTDYAANLRRLAVVPAQMVFETGNPHPDLDDSAYAQIMRDVAKEFGIPLAETFAYVSSLPGWQDHFDGGPHPDADIYALISAKVVVPALVPMVAKLRCE